MSSLLVLCGIGAAILQEALVSPPARAEGTHRNDQALRVIALTASVLLLGASIYASVRAAGVPQALIAAGLLVGGGWLRAAAMRNLGSLFRTEANAEHLVTTGIHGVMRHPSELGLLCWTLGLFVAAPSLFSGFLAAAQLPLLVARLQLEERALAERFGERWKRYASATPRLGF
ncbi:MAG: methyltransferase family protein [Nannocystales bacterium]